VIYLFSASASRTGALDFRVESLAAPRPPRLGGEISEFFFTTEPQSCIALANLNCLERFELLELAVS
jgi:hypothetical protein